MSGIISAAAQHESASRGLRLAPGVVVTRPDLLAADLEVAAADHSALVFAVVMEVAVVVTPGPHHFHCKIEEGGTLRISIHTDYL